jgi:TPR repeat protein
MSRLKHCASVIILLQLFSGPAHSDPLSDWRAEHSVLIDPSAKPVVPDSPEMFAMRIAPIKTKADKGDAEAIKEVCSYYCSMKAIPHNSPDAVKWCLKGAENGDSASQFLLGEIYANGTHGAIQSYAEAAKWFQRAAEQGNVAAEYNLARYTYHGWGVPPNRAAAVELFRRAADHDNSEAQNVMGWFYAQGDSVKQDYGQALNYFRAASRQGFPTALLNLGVMYEMGWGVQPDLTEASNWYQKAADRQHTAAMINLGSLAVRGPKRDYEEALHWFLEAAERGDASGQFFVANLYAQHLIRPDKIDAYKWASLALDTYRDKGDKSASSGRYFYPTDPLPAMANDMTPDQLAEAQKNIALWKASPHPGAVSLEIPFLTPLHVWP